ncbi:putative aldouronate transport system permease protein [Butyrivibrio fibrisolvens]|uniref:Putative aldouronate transport system permease protein n=1 Tax=Butyrivibrio fibrisolvens TaxID=831 RepID=A0A1H9VAS7_BUTFI|nr:ABC transporter permease subunit [Butyrivibrio fibrisolvens]SES18337.1 putative aldouronate transport system permease protein [Butyrivibrio fibrisolvens]
MNKNKQLFKRQLPLQLMVLPGIIFMLIFSYYPIYGLTIAFKNYTVIDTLSTARWVGLENFRIVATDKYFWGSVVNTLGISMLKLLIGFTTPIVLAILIYELEDGPFKKISQTISYLPHFLSWIILGGMVINWLSTSGMINQILLGLGLMDKPVNFLLDADKYWMIAVLADTWKEAGWGTILYLATMAGIDPTYYEAASIDGAGRLRQIISITLPHLRTIISLNLILTISSLLKSNLDQTLVLMNSQNRSHAEVIDSYVYRMGLTQGDFSYATAVGLGVSIVSVILLVIANQITKKFNEESVL